MLRHAVAAWGAAVWACTTVAATDGNGRLGVPRVASPPVVDGRMAEGEWHGAVPVGGFQALPKLTRPRTGQRGWLCWDDEALFAAFETWGEAPEGLAARATARDGGVWQDDAFELHLAAGSAGGTAVQFVGNSVGAVYDARGGDASWNGTWEYAASRTQTGWQGELSITWASLGLGTPGVGDVWRVLLCHDDANPDGAEVSACVPVRTNFHDVAAYMTATFGAGVVAAGVTEVSVEDGQASVVVRCVNGSAEPVSVHGTLQPVAGGAPVETDAVCPAQASRDLRFGWRMRSASDTRAEVRVADAEGAVLLEQSIPVSAWHRVRIELRNLLVSGSIELTVAGPAGEDGSAAYVFSDAEGRTMLEGTLSLPNGRGTAHVDTSGLAVGGCKLRVTSTFPGAEVNDARSWDLQVPPTPEWLDTGAGQTDGVLPPYTAIEVRNERLLCWGREYEFRESWLPTRIVSAHEELLAGPVRLLAGKGEAAVDLGQVAMRVTRQTPSRVETAAEGMIGGVSLKATAWMEEDGFWWVTAALAPAGRSELDRLVLEVPVRREVARYIHPSNSTWRTTSGDLPDSGWRGTFWPVVSLVNDDKGLAWSCESMRDWNPGGTEVMEVEVRGGVATLRCELIGKPTPLGDGLSFSFGLQACPVKPIPRDWRSRRIVHGARYGMEDRARHVPGALRYPAAGRIRFESGTLEAWVEPKFDPGIKLATQEGRGVYNNSFFHVGPPGDYYASLYWNIDDRGWRYVCYNRPEHELVLNARRAPWPDRSWRHVALTWGDAIRIYDNGELVVETPHPGLWNGRSPDLGDLQLRFGHLSSEGSRFRIREVRISDRPLSPKEMLLTADSPRRTATTLFHEELGGLAPGTKRTPAGGELHGGASVERAKTGVGVVLFQHNARSQIEELAELGCRTLVYHQRWTRDYGKPYTVANADRLDRLVEGCHDAGIKLLLYVGYGLGDLAPETRNYHDYWASLPIIRWASSDGDETQAFSRSCTGSRYWTDFMLHHLRETLTRHDFDGFYYDGTIGFRACMNAAHGCTYLDREGKRRPTYPVLATREYAKRLYALCRLHRETDLIDCHTSANVLPMRAAWVDQLWNGEQFQSCKPGFHFPMDYFRSQCVGTQYGVPSMFLTYHKRPFVEAEALSFTLLHDVLPRSRSDTIVRIWGIQDSFDVAGARWLPYWRNREYVQVTSDPPGRLWDEAGLVTLYLHYGARALLVVSNIQDAPATLEVRPYLERLGLADKVAARDAERDTPVELKDGVITLSLGGYDYRLLWLERE